MNENKVIVLSVRPEWLYLIMNGKKSVEVRKNATIEWLEILRGSTELPPEPIDVYLYCKNGKENLFKNRNGWFVSTEFGCVFSNGKKVEKFNGKVVAKFTLKNVKRINDGNMYDFLEDSCLTEEQLDNYLFKKGNGGFGWVIDNLVIFDKPKELGEFIQSKRKNYEEPTIQKAPQSWCYAFVEVAGL